MTALTIDFTEAPVGKYVAELKFTDKLGKKSASFELPFEIKGNSDGESSPNKEGDSDGNSEDDEDR